jgi:hypothetical protein
MQVLTRRMVICFLFSLLSFVPGPFHAGHSKDRDSGTQVQCSIEHLIAAKEQKGLVNGPAISDELGGALTTRDIDELMHELLLGLFRKNPEMFPADINLEEKLVEACHSPEGALAHKKRRECRRCRSDLLGCFCLCS